LPDTAFITFARRKITSMTTVVKGTMNRSGENKIDAPHSQEAIKQVKNP